MMVLSPQRSPRAHISTVFTTRMILLIFVKKWFDQHIPSGRGEVMMSKRVRKTGNPIKILIGFADFPIRLRLPIPPPGPCPAGVSEPDFFTKIQNNILVVNAVEI